MYKYTQEQPYTYRNAIMIMVFSVDPCALVHYTSAYIDSAICRKKEQRAHHTSGHSKCKRINRHA